MNIVKEEVSKEAVVEQQICHIFPDDTCPSYPLIMELLSFGDTYAETRDACGNPYVTSLDAIISLSSKDNFFFCIFEI